MWRLYADSLRSPRGGLVKLALLKGAVFYAFGIYCAVRAFAADDLRDVVLWTAGVLWAIAVVVAVKLWWWMEINRDSIVRSVRHSREHDGGPKD